MNQIRIFAVLLAFSAVLARVEGADCIALEGNCLNNARIATTCATGDVREGFGCPQGSTCCLPLGVMCAYRDGECQSDCHGGKLMDPDLPCDGGLSCCISRLSVVNAENTSPRIDPQHIQNDTPKAKEAVQIAALMTEDVPLTIMLALVLVVVFGLLGWAVAYRRSGSKN